LRWSAQSCGLDGVWSSRTGRDCVALPAGPPAWQAWRLAPLGAAGRLGGGEAVGKGCPGRLESRPQARKPAPHRTRHRGHGKGKPQRGRAATKQVWRHKKSSRAEKNLRASSTENTEDTEKNKPRRTRRTRRWEKRGRVEVERAVVRAGWRLELPHRSGLCRSAGGTAGMASLAACSTWGGGAIGWRRGRG